MFEPNGTRFLNVLAKEFDDVAARFLSTVGLGFIPPPQFIFSGAGKNSLEFHYKPLMIHYGREGEPWQTKMIP